MINFKFKTSERKDGPMNLLADKEKHWKSLEIDLERISNRAQFLSNNFGIKNNQSVIPKLQHGSVIESVERSNFGIAELPCDGLITTKKGLALTVTAGDCYPVMIYCPEIEVICLLHVGWRGLADKIVEKAIMKLYSEFGCYLKDMHVQVGPGICRKCYEVGPEVFKAFGYGHVHSKMNFNLLNEIEGQAAIIPPRNIHFNSCDHPCTYHQDEYFSARRDGKIGGIPNYQFAVAIMQNE